MNAHTQITAAISKMRDAELLALLCEAIENGGHSDDFIDAMMPVRDAFENAYATLEAIASGDADPDEAFWNEADYRYEQRRDDEMMRKWESGQ